MKNKTASLYSLDRQSIFQKQMEHIYDKIFSKNILTIVFWPEFQYFQNIS